MVKDPVEDQEPGSVTILKEACGHSLVEIERKAQDRGNWRSFVQWATTVRTRTLR